MQEHSSPTHSAKGLKIAVITSSYHSHVTSNMATSAENTFLEAGGLAGDCLHSSAAGAWELPILAKKIADSNSVDAILALGCIITGETTHDKVIGHAIANGLMQVSLDWGKPISMGVLTCQSIEQATARSTPDSLSNKGRESMIAAIKTASTLREL